MYTKRDIIIGIEKRRHIIAVGNVTVLLKQERQKSMKNLYTSKGWVDADVLIDSPAFITVAIGARGIGKTYGCLKTLYERRTRFIYCRRTQTQLDETCVQALNPYNKIASDNKWKIVSARMTKNTVGFYNAEEEQDNSLKPVGEPFAVGVALATFANIRGMSIDCDVMLFDEIIPERHERKIIKEEGSAFLNMLESLNRNRELLGQKPMHIILLSNSNTINSQILDSIGILKIIDDMQRRGIERKLVRDGLIEIILYKDSPISEAKKATALYRIANNKDFSDMALSNNFGSADFEQVCAKPLAEYNVLVSIGNITVYKHKSKREYYVIDGVKSKECFDMTPISVRNFRYKYNYIFNAYLRQHMFFSSVTAKINFERVISA